ncbi:MAG: metal ABC transporter ATP-binding protein [Fluviicola sp.]|jgi:manganese/zinc/iron transport system ATP- binding protein|nr:metal ABC transporter ATP-binding protein [Fluviicola sp.]
MENSSIEVHNLSVSYQNVPVLWDIDFTLPKGQIVGIIGPNGSGKSTLLKAIMGLIPLASGNVKVLNKNLSLVRDQLAYVPQRETVDWNFPASVEDVVLMGRYKKGNLFRRLTKIDKVIAQESIEKVKLEKYKGRQISQLSGGQQQRVFIARALAQGASIYIMDEPFVGVDMSTEKTILDLLIQMKEEGKTIIIVHHDIQTVSNYFDYIVMLNTRLIAHGPTNEVLTEENLQATYGGQLNIISKIQSIIKEKEFPLREKGFEDK